MLSDIERQYIYDYGYLPEQLIDYVVAVSEAEPFMLDNYLFFLKDRHLIFIGYPLDGSDPAKNVQQTLDSINLKYGVREVAFISPLSSPPGNECLQDDKDCYYRLDLSAMELSSGLRNSIRRAQREVIIQHSRVIDDRHLKLIDEFISEKQIDDATAYIFQRIPHYINTSATAQLFNAINREGQLAGFDIADYGSRQYAFYMFNFISRKYYVPGISDLLLQGIIDTAMQQGRLYLNMGLGINKGNVFFKKKWGAEEFMEHHYCFYKVKSKRRSFSMLDFFISLFRRNS